MPTMADIIIKKLDGTTDVTYEALTPSSGDKSEAKWRMTSTSSGGLQPALRNTLVCKTKSSVNGEVRILEGKFVAPAVVTVGTTDSQKSSTFSFTGTVNQLFTEAQAGEYAAQVANLLKATLMQSVIKNGYAPS